MIKTLFSELFEESEGNHKLLAQERFLLGVTEAIWEALEDKKWTKATLAGELGKSKSHVTQLLSGDRNMTLRTLADIAHVLGRAPLLQLIDTDSVYKLDYDKTEDDWETADILGYPAFSSVVVRKDIPVANNDSWTNSTAVQVA